MIYVTLQPRPLVLQTPSGAPLLDSAGMMEFSSHLTLSDCQTIDHIVASECMRRGLGRPAVGTRKYVAVEAVVASDIAARELDLSEIRAQIEEAKWLSG